MLEFDATLCIDLCVAQQLLQLYFHFQYSFAAGALRRVTLYAITQTCASHEIARPKPQASTQTLSLTPHRRKSTQTKASPAIAHPQKSLAPTETRQADLTFSMDTGQPLHSLHSSVPSCRRATVHTTDHLSGSWDNRVRNVNSQ